MLASVAPIVGSGEGAGDGSGLGFSVGIADGLREGTGVSGARVGLGDGCKVVG